MEISYYPGCTLKNTAKNFEDSTFGALKALDIEVKELPRWNCCGTVFSLAADDLIHHVAPLRILIRAMDQGFDKMVTLCAMCYNTLKRANNRIKNDPESLERINLFMNEESNYQGEVEVFHLLEFLRDTLGFQNIANRVKVPLENLKVACYYGCLLVRPRGIGFDDPENPTSMETLVAELGAQSVDFPFKTECCAAYQTVDSPGIVAQRAHHILTSAQAQGADIVVVSCPLCAFNLDHRQKETVQAYPGFRHIPVLYFTQLLAIALGCKKDTLGFNLHYIDPHPLLKERHFHL